VPHLIPGRAFLSPDGTTLEILGVRVDPVSLDAALRSVESALIEDARGFIVLRDVNGLMEAWRRPAFRDLLNRSRLCLPDGRPLLWLGRLAGFRHMEQVTGSSFMWETLRLAAARGWASFLYGGDQGVAESLADRLTHAFPGLRIAGTWCPPFRPLLPREEEEIAAAINTSGARLVWVGLSTPQQELWMARFLPLLKANLLFGVGAAFNFHLGRVRRAPAWMQRAGLEWLFRVSQEPARLWKRYLLNVPSFVILVIRQALGRAVTRETAHR
jgi:N-acetylglucosaminyldiphosphoundecaprenol N-acetyl-beta-D-mannosaminyltransferase